MSNQRAILVTVLALASLAGPYVPYGPWLALGLLALATVIAWPMLWREPLGALGVLTLLSWQIVATWLALPLLPAAALATALLAWRGARLAKHAEDKAWQLPALPTKAVQIVRGVEMPIVLARVQAGALLLVRPGEIIPVDGVVTEGSSDAHEHVLNGLVEPQVKLPSSPVYAGSTNGSGRLLIRVNAVGEETLIHRIAVRVMSSAHSVEPDEEAPKRSRQRWSLLLLLIALGAGVVWLREPQVAIAAFAGVLAASSTYLILTISPSALVRGLARRGVLIRDAATLRALAEVDVIMFDKRGILTTGEVRVEDVVAFKPFTQQQVLNLAAAVEIKSRHPIARTIVTHARSFGAYALQPATDFVEEPGRGASARVNNKRVLVGNEAFARRRKIKLPSGVRAHHDEGHSVTYVVQGRNVLGYIVLTDNVRGEARDAMKALKRFARLIVLSSDHEDTAVAIGRNAGVHEVIPDVAPNQRAEHIKAWKERGKVVAFVSNSVADEEARAAADVTITLGTFAAKTEQTGVTVMRRDLSLIKECFMEARAYQAGKERAQRRTLLYHVIALPLVGVTHALTYSTPYILAPVVGAAAAIVAGWKHGR